MNHIDDDVVVVVVVVVAAAAAPDGHLDKSIECRVDRLDVV